MDPIKSLIGLVGVNPVTGQGIEDQYVVTGCLANHGDISCVLFGVRVADDGSKFAIVGYPQEVPVDKVAVWSRAMAAGRQGKNEEED